MKIHYFSQHKYEKTIRDWLARNRERLVSNLDLIRELFLEAIRDDAFRPIIEDADIAHAEQYVRWLESHDEPWEYCFDLESPLWVDWVAWSLNYCLHERQLYLSDTQPWRPKTDDTENDFGGMM